MEANAWTHQSECTKPPWCCVSWPRVGSYSGSEQGHHPREAQGWSEGRLCVQNTEDVKLPVKDAEQAEQAVGKQHIYRTEEVGLERV